MALERYGGVFMMELLKKHIHMNRRRGNVTSQMTLDDDFNVPDSMDDVEELIMEKFLPAVHHEPTIVDLPWEE